MQFARFAIFTALVASAVMAAPSPQVGGEVTPDTNTAASSNGSCSVGTAQCCGTTKSGDDAKDLGALLGFTDLVGTLGLSCQKIPINIIGAAANVDNQCKQTPVCCTGERHNGLVQVGCTPLPIN
ncbi:hypothetical protein IE81DRAFT_325279 [Ceraceosorus guamensis]|uniref:Hydrophobin n=1 Tax=Ceraceosorus guamensis TaxID=1522189 RepID=A0A316VSZ2_9BASI|nr:hypothetical protein IE81DRAFT_325279 [Ceraceosorus guamensis]PWN40759.1 hypothetical protein IE81DRAFT_325279 [Ceraceosorus guamensis]